MPEFHEVTIRPDNNEEYMTPDMRESANNRRPESVSGTIGRIGKCLHTPGAVLVMRGILFASILLVLVLVSFWNFLLFHGIVEISAVAVAFAIFLLVWNTRRFGTDSFFLLIGISFLFIGIIDLVHTLAYKGMGVFPGNSSDLPTQLWIAARYFQSITLLFAALLIGKSLTKDRRYDPVIFFGACATGTAFLLASILIWKDFPSAFIDGTGLTPFKIGSEYVISLILVAVIVILFRKREYFDKKVWYLLVTAQSFLIAGELAFTSYVSVYGSMNMLGHLFRLVSVYLFYQAIIVVGLTRPTDILFRELKEREAALKKSEEQLQLFIEHAPAAVAMLDREMRYLVASRRWISDYNLGHKDIIGKSHYEIFPDLPEEWKESHKRCLAGASEKSEADTFVRPDGRTEWLYWEIHPWHEAGGGIGGVIIFSEVITARKLAEDELVRKNTELGAVNEELIATEEELQRNIGELTLREQELREKENVLSKALEEKEVLLSEIHHRVKNNLTAFISLLSLENTYEETPQGAALKKDLQNRARSMALIHETLYRTKEFSRVDMDTYLRTLVGQIAVMYNTPAPVKLETDAEGVSLDIARATPCGLIINEIITNSFKYAFPQSFDCKTVRNEPCTIRVVLSENAGTYLLTVSDNGIGLPAGMDIRTTPSLGLKLVNFLARHQLRATVTVDSSDGTEFQIRFGETTPG